MRVWRSPLFSCGLVLIVVGGGNLWVSEGKIRQYEEILQESAGASSRSEVYPGLTAEMTRDLLRPLRRGAQAQASNKLEFYGLVRRGGGFIVVAGAGFCVVGAGLFWRRQRLRIAPA